MAEEASARDEENAPSQEAPDPEGAVDVTAEDVAEPDKEAPESLLSRATKGLRLASPRRIQGALFIIVCGLLVAAVGYWVSTIVDERPFERIAYEDAPPEIQEWVDDNLTTIFTGRRTIGDHTYVFATYGRRISPGFEVEVIGAETRVLNVTVFVEFRQPEELVGGVVEHPFDLVRVEATRFPVTFTRSGLN